MSPLVEQEQAPVIAQLGAEKAELLSRLVEGLDGRALNWISGYLAGLASVAPAHAERSPRPAAAEARLTIVYGTQTGNSHLLAERLHRQAQGAGLAVRILSTGKYPLRELEKERLLYLVISTQGDGDPPDHRPGRAQGRAPPRARAGRLRPHLRAGRRAGGAAAQPARAGERASGGAPPRSKRRSNPRRTFASPNQMALGGAGDHPPQPSFPGCARGAGAERRAGAPAFSRGRNGTARGTRPASGDRRGPVASGAVDGERARLCPAPAHTAAVLHRLEPEGGRDR